MSKDAHSTKLPDDLAQCHALICELLAVKDELAASMRQQELEKARLLARVEHLLRQMYGRSADPGGLQAVLRSYPGRVPQTAVDCAGATHVRTRPVTIAGPSLWFLGPAK